MSLPNIVFIFADQMRASALGCLGVENVFTPNLDAFAKEGTVFTRAVSNHPVCCPARATIMTGLHSINHGLVTNDQQLRTDVPVLAQLLNGAGYKCGYVGKWHIDCMDRGAFIPRGSRRRGFDDLWAVSNCNHEYLNAYYYLNDDEEPIWIDGYEPDAQTDIAVDYISKKSDEKQPFCLFLSWGPPHCPYHEVPDEYLDIYPLESIKLKLNTSEVADKKIIAGYYAHITALDHCFGRIIKVIDEKSICNDTIVIFASDHGDMLFSHGRGWKMKPWAESVQIPFIVRWPEKIPANKTSSAPLGLVDVMPTVIGLVRIAGTDIRLPGVDGTDLAELFLGDETKAPASQYIYCPVIYKNWGKGYGEWRGIVTRTHTYVRLLEKEWLMFNDVEDPFQLQNLVQDERQNDKKSELDVLLCDWLDKTDDRFLSSSNFAKQYVYGKLINSEDKNELKKEIKDKFKEIFDRFDEMPDVYRQYYSRFADRDASKFIGEMVEHPDDDLCVMCFENVKIMKGKKGIGRMKYHHHAFI